MTVIAYRSGRLAGDGLVTSKEFVETETEEKVFKLEDGSLLGVAGRLSSCRALEAAFRRHIREENPVLPEGPFKGATAVFITPKKEVWLYEAGLWFRWHEAYVAIGSGAKLAQVALDCGSSAKKAVEVTCKRDIYCGGKILEVKL